MEGGPHWIRRARLFIHLTSVFSRHWSQAMHAHWYVLRLERIIRDEGFGSSVAASIATRQPGGNLQRRTPGIIR